MASLDLGSVRVELRIIYDVPGVSLANQMRWEVRDLCRACGADADLSWTAPYDTGDRGVVYCRYGLCVDCR